MFKKFRNGMKWWAIFCIPILVGACGMQEESSYQPSMSKKRQHTVPEYNFAIVPEGNQGRASTVYSPLIDYLNTRIEGATLLLIAPQTHEELGEGLHSRRYMFALVPPLHAIRSNGYGYHVIAKKGDDQKYYGIFLVRRDSGIKQVRDLKGKIIAYPSAAGVAAAFLPKQFLKSQGIDVNRDIQNHYVGSHESSLLHVYMSEAAAGTARDFSWKNFQKTHPKEAAELEVKWHTAPFIDQAIIARSDVPAELSNRIGKLLASLHETAEGRVILANMDATRFEPANDATYDKARKLFAENPELMNIDNKPRLAERRKP